MAQQSLILPAHVANRTLPQWLQVLPTFQQMNFDPALDQMLFANRQSEQKMAIKETHTQAIRPLRWDVHLIEVKYCDDTRPEQQLARATKQHSRLKHTLVKQCHKVSLRTILIGVMGTI